MASLLGLPDELLLKIANYIHQDAESRQQALVNLALSSCKLTGIATKLLYQAPAVTELKISNFQRSVLTLKDVSKNITKLDLNLESPGLYKASEFARLPNCTELVLRVNTRVFFTDLPQYKHVDKFLEAFPKVKALSIHVTNVECNDVVHRENPDDDCLLDANFCSRVDSGWIHPDRRGIFAPELLVSKLQVTARTLERLQMQLYQKDNGVDFEDHYFHWLDYFFDLSRDITFRGFENLKELVIPAGVFLSCSSPRTPGFAENLLPAGIQRLVFLHPRVDAWYWLRPILEVKGRCYPDLHEVELCVNSTWQQCGREYCCILFGCTVADLESADVKLVSISEPEGGRILTG